MHSKRNLNRFVNQTDVVKINISILFEVIIVEDFRTKMDRDYFLFEKISCSIGNNLFAAITLKMWATNVANSLSLSMKSMRVY